MSDSRFERCLGEVLRHEGGYADHPADPGGATKFGITRKTLARWRHVSPWSALPKSEVRDLGREEAGRIYRALYWTACGTDRLPPGIDLALFDYAVNSGPDRAVRTMQAALGVAADGVVGPVTERAAQQAEVNEIIDAICDQRLVFLQRLSNFSVFGAGWTARVKDVRATAKAMVEQPTRPRSVEMTSLSGYKTYIVAAIMLLAGVAQIMGIDLPSLEGGSAGSLVLEALAVMFLRRGLKSETLRQ